MPILALLVLALALGTDSFSVSICLGTQAFSGKRIVLISLVVGLLHVLMPLAGLILGRLLGRLMGQIGNIIGSLILSLIGVRMIVDKLHPKSAGNSFDLTQASGLILFALGVSIDALSTGISLGIHGGYGLLIIVLTIGLTATVMTSCGLRLGRYIKKNAGEKAEILGGIVLIGLSVYFFLT